MTNVIPQSINDFLIEIRFSPNAKILDYRGQWAEAISQHMELSEWQIQENRLDIFDKEQARRFFVSYRNAGALIRNSSTRNYFSDQVNKFLKYLFEQKSFGDKLNVERFGVRGRFATAFSGSFEELLNLYSTKFITIRPEALKVINAKIVDIGMPIDFSTNNGNINSASGPMAKSQLSKIFDREKNLPEVALYFEFDYWVRPNVTIIAKDILNKTKTFSGEVWDLNENLCSVISG